MSVPLKIRTLPLKSLDLPEAHYHGFRSGSETLPSGWQGEKGALPLPVPIIHDRDVPLKMRDGVTLYADVFRPVTSDLIPAIVNWSPYGKGGTGSWRLDDFPNRFGIPNSLLSGLQAWEGNDPAYWCAQGYAIVQVDARGAFDSEGDIIYFGIGEGRDGHDAVEEIAALPWCSGKVGMSGNSWLAIAQWQIAAQRPAHLAAIAPWEGLTDAYRDIFARGGIPNPAFPQAVADRLYGRNRVEDPMSMLADHPLVDDYWESKIADVPAIDIPVYVVASYSNMVHVQGTFRAWQQLRSKAWLRIHNTVEWPDFYDPKYTEDLRRFFDRYLKDIDNGWEQTPTVRMSVLNPGHTDIVDLPEAQFPPADVVDTSFYLDAASESLTTSKQASASATITLKGAKPYLDFIYRFDRDVEIVGFPAIRLNVSVTGYHDADIFVQVQKLNAHGKQLYHQASTIGLPLGRLWMPTLYRYGVKQLGAVFYPGPDGLLRLSRRGLRENLLELDLREEKPLKEGEVVEVTIPLLPTGLIYQKGEQLRLRVSSKPLKAVALPGLAEPETLPAETIQIHTGGEHVSKLIMPMRSSNT